MPLLRRCGPPLKARWTQYSQIALGGILNQIASWHSARKHERIREAIIAIPKNERNDELVSLLARALNNEDNYSGALEGLTASKLRIVCQHLIRLL